MIVALIDIEEKKVAWTLCGEFHKAANNISRWRWVQGATETYISDVCLQDNLFPNRGL